MIGVGGLVEDGPVGGLKGREEGPWEEDGPLFVEFEIEPRGPVGMLDGPVGVDGEGETPAEACRDNGGAFDHPPRPPGPLPPRELKLPRPEGGT